MGELWRDLVDLLRRRPLLWLPVLLADLLGYLVNLGRTGLLTALLLHQTAQHSALGGTVVHTPLSPSAMQSTAIIALLLSWIVYFFRIMLYSAALVATASLVRSYLQRDKEPGAGIGASLASHWGGILELTLRALAVYAIAALIFSSLSAFLLKHNYLAILRTPWLSFTLGLLVLLILAVFLPPVALRVLSGRAPGKVLAGASQQFAAVLAIVVTVLAAFVTGNSREMAHIAPAVRYPLEIVASLLVALPYVLLFTGLALLARQVRQGDPELETAA